MASGGFFTASNGFNFHFAERIQWQRNESRLLLQNEYFSSMSMRISHIDMRSVEPSHDIFCVLLVPYCDARQDSVHTCILPAKSKPVLAISCQFTAAPTTGLPGLSVQNTRRPVPSRSRNRRLGLGRTRILPRNPRPNLIFAQPNPANLHGIERKPVFRSLGPNSATASSELHGRWKSMGGCQYAAI